MDNIPKTSLKSCFKKVADERVCKSVTWKDGKGFAGSEENPKATLKRTRCYRDLSKALSNQIMPMSGTKRQAEASEVPQGLPLNFLGALYSVLKDISNWGCQ